MKKNDVGLAGVATLIIFTTLILTAAISAAIIIDVTGVLEQQAQKTGQDTSDQLSSSPKILTVIGQVQSGKIQEVQYVLTVGSGTQSIDLTRVTIDYITSKGSTTLTNNGDDPFEIVQLAGDTDNDIISNPNERYRIDVNHDDLTGIDRLEENDRVEARFTTGPGGRAFDEFIVPSVLLGQDETITL